MDAALADQLATAEPEALRDQVGIGSRLRAAPGSPVAQGDRRGIAGPHGGSDVKEVRADRVGGALDREARERRGATGSG